MVLISAEQTELHDAEKINQVLIIYQVGSGCYWLQIFGGNKKKIPKEKKKTRTPETLLLFFHQCVGEERNGTCKVGEMVPRRGVNSSLMDYAETEPNSLRRRQPALPEPEREAAAQACRGITSELVIECFTVVA